MNIEVLREFVDLAYTLNYQKTAKRLYISHSALSKHISALEKELGGIALFYRTKRTVELTPLGKVFLPRVERILSEYDSALAVIQSGRDEMSGVIRVGFLDDVMRDILPSVITRFNKTYPKILIKPVSGQVGDILSLFYNHQLDLGLTMLFPNSVPPTAASIRTLFEESIHLACPKNHPLANKEQIYVHDLLQYPLIMPSREQYTAYASLIEGYIESGPITPQIVCDYSDVNTALIMTKADQGVTLLPSHIAQTTESIVFREIHDFCPVLKVIAVWDKREMITGLQEFIEILCKEADEYFQSDN